MVSVALGGLSVALGVMGSTGEGGLLPVALGGGLLSVALGGLSVALGVMGSTGGGILPVDTAGHTFTKYYSSSCVNWR